MSTICRYFVGNNETTLFQLILVMCIMNIFTLKVEATLDKTICAMSSVRAPGSTFTEDILQLRKDWGSALMCDE